MKNTLSKIFNRFKGGLTENGLLEVIEKGRELEGRHIKIESKPEEYTKNKLVVPILTLLDLKIEGVESKVTMPNRKKTPAYLDYTVVNREGTHMFIEVKSYGAKLYSDNYDSGVNQVKTRFGITDVHQNYQFGVATDGVKFIILTNEKKVVADYNVLTHLQEIKDILNEVVIKQPVDQKESISKGFYSWYRALLIGGDYSVGVGSSRKSGKILESRSLVESLVGKFRGSEEAQKGQRKQLAQIVIDRLIFIKFLQNKGIIRKNALNYIAKQSSDRVDTLLKQLFFKVFNTMEKDRFDIDSTFKDFPYLNGALFFKTKLEKETNYSVKSAAILSIIAFLDSFTFDRSEKKDGLSNDEILDPEILGYIFEKSMNEEDRKEVSGAYYTPSDVTTFLSKTLIMDYVLMKINDHLRKKGFKENELIISLSDLHGFNEPTIKSIFEEIKDIRICDPTCGSGAFLLSSAQVLLTVFTQVLEEVNLDYTELDLRKRIITQNLFGVDINESAVEIAKLRLWLWLVEVYEGKNIEPLPNIEYNLRVGNTLIGNLKVTKYYEEITRSLDSYATDTEQKKLLDMLKERKKLILHYLTSPSTSDLKENIEAIHEKCLPLLNPVFSNSIRGKIIEKKDVPKLKPFHWGFEFFHEEAPEGFFDIIIGNPPYGRTIRKKYEKRLGLKEGALKEALERSGYETFKIAEYSSHFVERFLQLLKPDGRIGLVITSGLVNNNNMNIVRKIVREELSNIYIASFGLRPTKLFPDVDLNISIVWGKKKKTMEDKHTTYTTNFIKFNSDERVHLFNNLKFKDTTDLYMGKNLIGQGNPGVIAKIGDSKGVVLLKILKDLQRDKQMKTLMSSENKTEYSLEFRGSGKFYLAALQEFPYHSSTIKKIYFDEEVLRDFTIILIHSSLFHFFWSVYGNLQHLHKLLIERFPAPEEDFFKQERDRIFELKEIITEVARKSFSPRQREDMKKEKKEQQRDYDFGEFEMGEYEREIDMLDSFLAQAYGFNSEMLEYIKNYDRHVRFDNVNKKKGKILNSAVRK